MILHFAKYEGAGNDFVVIDARSFEFDPQPELVRALCDRHFGIGADGLMSLGLTDRADFKMRYYNSNGYEASMCGNGGRCITLFAHHIGISGKTKLFIGADGEHDAKIVKSDDSTGVVELQMRDVKDITRTGEGYRLDTGSPHLVVFVEDTDSVDVVNRGRKLRDSVEGGTNVNFVQITGPDTIKIRTYERGVENETYACGTGATACAIATHLHTGSDKNRFAVQTLGGRLTVEFAEEADGSYTNIKLTGGARKVFCGKIELNDLKLKSK